MSFGIIPNEETRKKMSISHKGKIIHDEEFKKRLAERNRSEENRKKVSTALRGRVCTEETKRKIGLANKNRKVSEETKQKMRLSHKNRPPQTEETKRKKSEKLKGRKLSKEQVEILRRVNTGRIPWNKGMKGFLSGEKHYNWKGGISFEPYSLDWKASLRRSIRERDNYVCKICNSLQDKISFDVHHIDYDKKNCDPKNLITLCRICHTKTNHNREYWKEYFKKLITISYV